MRSSSKEKEMTTLEVQEEMYKKALEDYKWRNGASLEDMLNKINSAWEVTERDN